MPRSNIRGKIVYNFVTDEAGEVVAHGTGVKATVEGQRDNPVIYDAGDSELTRLLEGAPVTWHEGKDEPVVGKVPVPPPPPPQPTEEENRRIRELHAKKNAVALRAIRYPEVAPLQDQVAAMMDHLGTLDPKPEASSPLGQILAKIDAVKATYPKITEKEQDEYEGLMDKFPHLLEGAPPQ